MVDGGGRRQHDNLGLVQSGVCSLFLNAICAIALEGQEEHGYNQSKLLPICANSETIDLFTFAIWLYFFFFFYPSTTIAVFCGIFRVRVEQHLTWD